MALLKERQAEPIPGYRLLEPLGRGAFGEVWKCEAPGGLYKAIKFVYGNLNGLDADSAQAEEELRAIQRIKSIRHPFLLSMDRVESVDGELLIVTELADKSLHELLEECQAAGRPGIEREQLLAFLREAAEVFDLMNLQFELQHLDIKPRNLFLVSNHVKVADFGLVNSLAGGAKPLQLGGITPLYASPEVFLGKISKHSDQYSLAIVFQELLTGTLPFQGTNSRQLLLAHTKGTPDLTALRSSDRRILARALSKDPAQRFPSCTELVVALAGSKPSMVLTPNGSATEDTAFQIPKMSDTQPFRARAANAKPPTVPGYRVLENVGSSLLSEVWKAKTADDKSRLLKFIYGFTAPNGRGPDEAVMRLKALCHPGLPRVQVVRSEPGVLVLAVDYLSHTLRDRLVECQAASQPGIPRAELLNHLRTAAEVLDYFAHQQGVYHLGLNPRTLLLEKYRLQLADFGLAHLLWAPAGQTVAQRNYSYSAPELFEKQINPSCDQYSLALIYHELLTGVAVPPTQLRATNGTRRGLPDLTRLPARDRDLIARALHADPHQRWPSCSDFVQSLEAVENSQRAQLEPDRFNAKLTASPAPRLEAVTDGSTGALNDLLSELIRSAGGTPAGGDEVVRVETDAGALIEYKFRAGLPVGLARQKLNEFRQHWSGLAVRDEEDCFAFQLNQPIGFWRRWLGRQPGLLVQIQLTRPHALSATPIDVTAQLRAIGCGKKRGTRLLDERSGTLLDSLRGHLLVNSEKRTQDRLLWPHALRVCPVDAQGREGPPVECRGKDISLSGMGFYLPHELESSEVCIKLPTPLHPPALSIPATLVRAKRCADGWYEVGALFRLASMRQTMQEICLD